MPWKHLLMKDRSTPDGEGSQPCRLPVIYKTGLCVVDLSPHNPTRSHCLCSNSSERKDVLSLCHRPENRMPKSLWQYPFQTVTFIELKGLIQTRNFSAQEWKTGSTLNRMDGPKFRVLKIGDLNATDNLPLSCHERSVDESWSPQQ